MTVKFGIRHAGAALILAGLCAGGLWSATGPGHSPAVAQTWTGSGESLDDLRYRLGLVDAELADIRARMDNISAGTVPSQVPSGGGSGSAGGDGGVRLDRLEAEIRRLTGIIERVEFQQRQMAEDAGRRFGDIEFRLTELEGGDVGALAPQQPLGGGAGGGTQTASTGGADVSVSEGEDLDRAIADVQQGRFDQGEDRLRDFLQSYPGSPLTAKAQYWLGQSQFARGAFQQAARSYLDGYNTNRRGQLAPQNLLKLGVTLGRLGQRQEACLTLREVRNQFPNGSGEVLTAADAEADSLACGG